MKFSSPVINKLNHYVYIYSDPTTNKIFYVGEGKGNRVFSHLEDSNKNQKVQVIDDIRKKGLEPKIEILIHGLKDKRTALRVESSIIDLLGIQNLTNKQKGYKSASFGRMSIKQTNSVYDKQKVEITEPSILIRIKQAFRYTMTDTELYDYTRGQWRVSLKRAKNAKYGFAVYGGIIQEVYEILNWYEGGKTYNVRKEDEKIEGRYEFVGNVAPSEIRKKYRGKSVEHYFKRGNSNPIMYVNL